MRDIKLEKIHDPFQNSGVRVAKRRPGYQKGQVSLNFEHLTVSEDVTIL